MKIFRHKKNKLLYTLERVIEDLKFLNNNAFAGVHPHSYKHKVEIENFYSKINFECEKFIKENFILVSEE
jgi:hypothetical protein